MNDNEQTIFVPKRLSWVTVPMMIVTILLGFFALSISIVDLEQLLKEYSTLTGREMIPLKTDQDVSVLRWGFFTVAIFQCLAFYIARKAVIRQYKWGRWLSIFLAFLMLPSLPFGTLIGIVMLIGLFDRDVVLYAHR